MSLSNTTKKVSYSGLGAGNNGPYAITFGITHDSGGNATNIEAEVVYENGTSETLTMNNSDITTVGNNVYTNSTAYTGNDTITIYRKMNYTQVRDWRNNDYFDAEDFEEALDEVYMHLQELAEQYERNVSIPISDEAVTMILPTKTMRASKTLGFDSDGEPIAGAGTSQIVNAFLESFLSDSSSVAEFLSFVGINATGDEINRACDVSASVVSVDQADFPGAANWTGVRRILMRCGSADRTATLPSSNAAYLGEEIEVVQTDYPSSSYSIIIAGNGTDKINGESTIKVRKSARLVGCHNGTSYCWKTIGDDGVPVGAIIAFGGNTTTMPGYLHCDGSLFNRAAYSRLNTYLNNAWGAGDANNAVLPNGQAMCLTGAGNQTLNNTVKTGPNVGVTNEDMFQDHFHQKYYCLGITASAGNGAIDHQTSNSDSLLPNARGAIRSPIASGSNGTPRVGAYTRPNEIGVRFFIKY